MLRKNVATQSVWGQMNSRTDGSPLTAAVSINVASAGAYGAGGGTLTHRGSGLWEYVLTQAETNYNFLAYQFTHATGVCVGGTVITTAANPTSATDFGLTNLDAAITSRSTYAGGAVASVTGNVGGNVVGTVGKSAMSLATADVTGNLPADLKAITAGVDFSATMKTALNAATPASIVGNVGGNVVGSVASVTNDVGITQAGADKVWGSAARTLTAFSTTLALSVWDVLTAAIAAANSIGVLLKTNLDATVSSRSTYAGTAVASVTAAVTVGTNNDKTNYQLAANQDVRNVSGTITDKTGYALTAAYDPAKTAAQAGNAMTLTTGERDSIAAALLDLANGVETGYTVKQALRVMAAVLAGKASGYPAGPGVFRNLADSANRASVTNDADGNRTAVTLTP